MKHFAFLILCICLCNASFVQEFEKLKFEIKQNSESNAKIWVLLVAGSNGYYNYRHQVKISLFSTRPNIGLVNSSSHPCMMKLNPGLLTMRKML